MNKMKVIYIAGYSRSGSTILDLLLGSDKQISSTGELAYLLEDWNLKGRICTCGDEYEDCEFWKDLSFNDEHKDIIREVEHRHNLKMLKKDSFPQELTHEYSTFQEYLFDFISEKSGNTVIVDSSKTSRYMAGRFLALHNYVPNIEVYVIHLIRNGLDTLQSYLKKGRNWALEGYGKNDRFQGLRAIMGWCLANSIAYQLGRQLPENRYIQVKYNDLVTEPSGVLNNLGNFLNEDFSGIIDLINNKEPLKKGHNVGGNRLRNKEKVIFKTQNRKQKDHSDIAWHYKFIFKIFKNIIYKIN